jgi:hypothetical protein
MSRGLEKAKQPPDPSGLSHVFVGPDTVSLEKKKRIGPASWRSTARVYGSAY